MTDELLLSEINKNPSKGFSLLLKEYSPLVFKICRAVLGSVGTNEDAQECAADVFSAFFKNLEKVDLSRGSIKGYLAFGAKNEAIDRYRKLKKETGKVFSIEEAGELPGEEQAFDESEKKEKNRLLKSAIESLGEPDRTIIVSKYFLGETAQEIGKKISLSAEAVQKRSRRALKKLKVLLEKAPGGVMLD
ncbi:MAG: sigma-70 family RNA polymerase sigma factor [Clostridia bacterium]|nr:sigma-70 family RNA polymerase sigma factor [Clostridia bacterium]